MKNVFLICIALVIFQKWDVISSAIRPPPDYSAISQGEVVLYATSWCGYCQKTRDFLAKRNIRYKEYDIEKSEEGRRQYDSIRGKGVPVLIVNDTVIHGYSPKAIEEALRKK
ncbi:MAG: glutaredoxin family protein [Cellvibrionaceae bacterium]